MYTCSLLQRETLFLSSKAAHYINILEKQSETKAVNASANKTYRNHGELDH